MVIVPGHFVFVANPRTGSRSVGALLEGKCSVRGVKRSGCRHMERGAVPTDIGLPVWAFTRHPYRHALSWWYFLCQKADIAAFNEDRSRMLPFEDWLRKDFDALPGHDFPKQRLNLYQGVATHWWKLEDGVEGWLRSVMLGDVADRIDSRDYIGRSGVDLSLLTPRAKRLIEARFSRDMELWDSLM